MCWLIKNNGFFNIDNIDFFSNSSLNYFTFTNSFQQDYTHTLHKHNNLSATTGYHATHIYDIAYPAYVKSAAPSHIVYIYVYIRCITWIDNCTDYMYVYSAHCLLYKSVSMYCLYVNCFCTVWSTLSRISLSKAHVLW